MSLQVDISEQNSAWEDILPSYNVYAPHVLETISQIVPFDVSNMDVSLVLADNIFVQNLNKQYRGKDKPTNVLSFPQIEAEDMHDNHDGESLGDIIVALETLQKEAEEQEKSFQDHFTHMLVHGFLHLCGYDHLEEKQAEEMETLEVRILADLGIRNPYE